MMRYSVFILIAWSILMSFYTYADNDPITDSELAVQRTCSLEAIWKDKGSGADLDGFFYLPYVDFAAFILGGYGTRTKKLSPMDCVLTVSEEKHLVAPKDWELIWKDKGSGAKKDGSMWRAVPPDNDHVCIGTIPQKGYEKPVLSNYRCVNAKFTEKVITNSLIWSDKGSGAKKKVTMFKLPNSGSFVAVEARLAQLETYDLKVDSSLLGVIDETKSVVETNIQDNTRISDNEKINNNTGKKLLSVIEQATKEMVQKQMRHGPQSPDEDGCYYDRGKKQCYEENHYMRNFRRSRIENEEAFIRNDYRTFKRKFCEENDGMENKIEWNREEARGNPAAYDKRFGTVIIDCETDNHTMEFGIDSLPADVPPNKLLFEKIMLVRKLVNKTPAVIIFDTDGKENEFERQTRELCEKNDVQFYNTKTY